MIRINFTDFWKGFNKESNYFINFIRGMYGADNVVISDNPDYLFYSCFGFENLKYDCIKIFFTGENIVPDFNLCDYALGVHNIVFGDRYMRLPFYMLYQDAYERALNRNGNFQTAGCDLSNRKFCCYVISNALADSFRNDLIGELEKYKTLGSGGRLNNNVGGPVEDKLDFISKYKFCLCFENSSAAGYTTEKILEGFAGGCVPVYWGNPDISSEFNEKAFINCNKFSSIENVIDEIKRVDNDAELYISMAKEPIFTEQSTGKREEIEKRLHQFFSAIFALGADNKRVNTVYVGERYIERMKYFRKQFEFYRKKERCVGFIKNKFKQGRQKNDYSSVHMS